MRKIQYLIISTFFAAILYNCGSGNPSDLAAKKAKLEEYKKQLAEIKSNIDGLEAEISKLDTSFQEETGNVLVSAYKVEPKPFVHKIEVRGSVESRKNVMISAETMGRIEAINVSEGREIGKGALLIKLDADVLENNIAEVKTQLELAQTKFKRQENLWKQNIGSEIQYLETKNNKESLERKLQTLNSQLSQAYIRAPFSGVVDDIPVKVGEMAQPGSPLVRIVSQNEMYIKADVSESYLGRLGKGDQVEIYFPSQDTKLTSKIGVVGKVINDQNRTFSVEVAIPGKSGFEFRPNQVVVLTMTDYENKTALSVPTRVIQSDEQGKYLFALGKEDGKDVAKKVRVETGMTFNNMTEILSGLSGNEKIIDKGYRDVNEGAEISIATASL